MNKDDYLKYQTRSKIVDGFLAKMNPVDVKDIDIVASLNHYVETGDESFFKEFLDFHFIKKVEEKKKIKEEYEEALRIMKQSREEYKKYLEEYSKWYEDICDYLERRYANTGTLLLHDIGKFATKFQKQNGYDRKVWCLVDGELRPIEDICWSDENNKVIIVLKGEKSILPEMPVPAPMVKSDFDFEYSLGKYFKHFRL